MTKEEVSQIWAEALIIYKNGEKLFLEGEDAKMAEESQKSAIETDEREGLVRDYLDTLLPNNWDKMTVYERRNYLSGSDFGEDITGTEERKYVCNMEIWCECFGKDSAAMKPTDAYAISSIMNKIDGWKKSDIRRYTKYGRQRIYQRTGQDMGQHQGQVGQPQKLSQ